MDSFNLHWPGGDATLHTDGARCRISWRAANGMGGSIENNDQAKRRAALGLAFAPTLLEELRQAGHGALAGEIEQLAPPPAQTGSASGQAREKPAPAEKAAEAKQAAPPREAKTAAATEPERLAQSPAPEQKPAPAKAKQTRIVRWLDALDGSAAFEACGVRRASSWHHGKTWPEGLELKAPQGGSGEWIVKVAAGKAQYFSAETFRGVCACLAALDTLANDAFFAAFLDGCKALRLKEVQLARERWAATK